MKLFYNKSAFTLSEVLITLGIIGIVATLTIPTLMNNIQETQYKTAYKKAYSALSQAFLMASQDGDIVELSGVYGSQGGEANFGAIKKQFKIVKECECGKLSGCWNSAGEQWRGDSNWVPAFVDNSGFAWKLRTLDSGASTPVILVDTNGNKGPNQYGKDRFPFLFFSASQFGSDFSGLPKQIMPYQDILVNDVGNSCVSAAKHPCYFTSWLYN